MLYVSKWNVQFATVWNNHSQLAHMAGRVEYLSMLVIARISLMSIIDPDWKWYTASKYMPLISDKHLNKHPLQTITHITYRCYTNGQLPDL